MEPKPLRDDCIEQLRTFKQMTRELLERVAMDLEMQACFERGGYDVNRLAGYWLNLSEAEKAELLESAEPATTTA